MIKVNVIAEKFIGKANGVYTAFLETVDALKKQPDITLSVNSNWDDCDIVHAHSIGLDYILKSFKYRHKLIVSAHVVPDSFIGSLILSEWWKPVARWYLKLAFSRAKLVIAVSPVVKEELQKIHVHSDIRVLCNSVDRKKFMANPELRKHFREKYGIRQDEFVVTCVGQVQPRKGIYDFLETARNVPKVRFIWVGGRPFGRLTADFDTLTKAVENAPSNVLFTGIAEFSDMPGCYAMSDVFFMPSYPENFAFATIEASAVKLPLLLRDNIEYPGSLFTHYLKGKTASDFTNIVEKLYTDPEFYALWQKESDTLASKYELNAHIKQLVAFYKEVSGKA